MNTSVVLLVCMSVKTVTGIPQVVRVLPDLKATCFNYLSLSKQNIKVKPSKKKVLFGLQMKKQRKIKGSITKKS